MLEQIQRLDAVKSARSMKAAAGQHAAEQLLQLAVVLHDQNSKHRVHLHCCTQ